MEGEFTAQVAQAVAIYGTGAGIFLVFCVMAEIFLRWREGKRPLQGEGAANFMLFPFGPIAEGLFLNALLIGGLFFFYNLTPLRVPVEWWTLPIYFIVGEFGYYWFHRAGHEVRLLWADHSIHHSAEVYDFTVNLRQVPFQAFYRLLIWIPLVLVGFNPLLLVLLAIRCQPSRRFAIRPELGVWHLGSNGFSSRPRTTVCTTPATRSISTRIMAA